ncbi:parallel beta-helix domain-containing protein [Paraferrimonas sp. SM1919]|uniref:parallel beta-helix domain-containing protein n=1 Tax=Paraferrimonas sp. SM1919 TaxID=2662263 RepID=UPI001F09C288|nr:parallel beta-helix domain-containing protein [Paraferrimonas sp. SM1919]
MTACNDDKETVTTVPVAPPPVIEAPAPDRTFPQGAIMIEAGDGLTTRLQEALINAQAGDVIVLPKGRHMIDSTLSFDGSSATNVSILGYGMEQTILDFSGSQDGDGIFVQNAKNILMEDLSVYEANNNGIKLKNSNGIILRRVGAVWEGELNQGNGAYGLYPVECENILIEDSYSRGSADAGIYVGQSKYIVVRRNLALENVAGIEIENSMYADVYDNVARGNTGGILVFDLPIGNHRYGSSVRIFNNIVDANNTHNFANASANPAGVHIVPPGTGMIILSTRDVEIFNNTITNHDSMAIAISSFFIAEQDKLEPDLLPFVEQYTPIMVDGWRPIPRNIHIHHNTIERSGLSPNGKLIEDIILAYLALRKDFPDILYDGIGPLIANSGGLLPLGEAPFAEDGSDNICVNNNGTASIGQLFKTGLDLANPDTLLEKPAEGTENTLLFCSQPPLPTHAVTFAGEQFGCNIDDDFAGCDSPTIVENEGGIGFGTGGLSGDGDLSLCSAGEGANWTALLGANCPKLSDYNLFVDPSDPTKNANSGGLAYDLNTQLFTDYASKYRYVFIPEGESAEFNATEVFNFPVGTVITKTFAMPANTANRGIANESLIETRLLIRRVDGWAALPYVWNAEKTDAVLTKAGASQNMMISHNGQDYDFNYKVPNINDCKQCHQFKADANSAAEFLPIGPKARNLNKDFDHGAGAINQLTAWAQAGILVNLPELSSVDSVPSFNDTDAAAIATMSDTDLMANAKAYLDINCAHCHRPEGNASNTGLKLEYGRSYASDPFGHGTCKSPVAYGGGNLSYDTVPGDADNSIMHYRMASTDPGDRMPEIGRSLAHLEGVALIKEWINRLPAADCSPQ